MCRVLRGSVFLLSVCVVACGGAASDVAVDAGVDAQSPDPVAASEPYVDHVDPFVGTGGAGYGVGSAFPGAQVPFGMARPSPDTSIEGRAPSFAHCSGYSYADTHIDAFSHTRMHGTGIVDYGVVSVMPTLGMSEAKTSESGYRSAFSHSTEEAAPGYYAVTLEDTNIRVELTATEHAALHRWTFPAGSDAVVVMDNGHAASNVSVLDADMSVDAEAHELSGFVHFSGGYSERFGGMPVYFVARFLAPFARFGVFSDGVLRESETHATGASSGAYVAFDVSGDASIEAAVGLSFTDVAHARMNLDAEVPSIDFNVARTDASAAWETQLQRIEVEGRDVRDFTRFYTALYHVFMMPTIAMDVDGTYRGMDGDVHVAEGFRYYTDFSLWDTFRTLHPLLALIAPEKQRDFLMSLLAMGNDAGAIDRWPLGVGYTNGMVGDSAALVFADSVKKGISDFDVARAYELLRASAMGPLEGSSYEGRSGIEAYIDRHYVPSDEGSASVSRTLEYAYDDFGLARLAEHLGSDADRLLFDERSRNYRNLYDPAQQFFVARSAAGDFVALESSTGWDNAYTEGNAWQYLWYAPHDLPGLFDVLGGESAARARLDDFFTRSRSAVHTALPDLYYWHGNEPDLHAAFVYAALGDQSEASAVSHWILSERYGLDPAGLSGNDDAGTLSAWFVFASSGIYPIAGTGDYLLGGPIFTRVLMHLEDGDLEIMAPNASPSVTRLRQTKLDSVNVDRAMVAHEALRHGAHLLEFQYETP